MDTRHALALLSLPSSATRGDARRAYRRLAALTHPDVGGSELSFRRLAAAAEQLLTTLPEGGPTTALTAIRFARRPVTPTITPGGDYQLWSGADWTGASSGLAWIPTPPPARRRGAR